MLPRDDVAVVVRRPNDVHTIYGFLYLATDQAVVFHLAHLLASSRRSQTTGAVGEVDGYDRATCILRPFLGNGVLLKGNELIDHDAFAFSCGKPFGLHILQHTGSEFAITGLVSSCYRFTNAVDRETRLKITVLYGLNSVRATALYGFSGSILHEKSGGHYDLTEVVSFVGGDVQRSTVGNDITVLIGKLQWKIALCLDGKGRNEPDT